ncbi:MAG: DUF4062 domain-containing protein [Anaerolineae bacterium]|nr:DUF4062 domain-containing protein [Anaerolineae bacterium]
MIKIFISSTSNDLKPYREIALEICKNQIDAIEPIAMEYFGAVDESSVETCLRKVREATVYVGIFAHRYGYIPPNETRSITEMEFDEATRIGIKRLCFIVDPEHPWNPRFIECSQQDKLETFKRRIDSKMVRASFTDPQSFRSVFVNSLRDWLSEYRSTKMTQAVDDEAFDSILPEEPSLLVGREQDLAFIKDRLKNMDTTRNSAVVLQGYPGVGKTTLVKKIVHDREINGQFPDGVLWVNVGADPKIVDELQTLANTIRLSINDEKPEEMQNAIQKKLSQRRVLLIVDDVWNADHAKYFNVVGRQGAVIFTTRQNSVAEAIQRYFDNPHLQRLRHLNEDEGYELLSHVEIAPQFSERHSGAARQLVKDLEGLPLALKVAGGLLESRMRRQLPVTDLLGSINSEKLLLSAKVEERFDAKTGTTPTVDYVFRQSTDALDEEARIKLAELALMAPKPATFSFEDLEMTWQSSNTILIISRLIDQGLVEPTEFGRFQIHSLVMMHARRLAEQYGILDD